MDSVEDGCHIEFIDQELGIYLTRRKGKKIFHVKIVKQVIKQLQLNR